MYRVRPWRLGMMVESRVPDNRHGNAIAPVSASPRRGRVVLLRMHRPRGALVLLLLLLLLMLDAVVDLVSPFSRRRRHSGA